MNYSYVNSTLTTCVAALLLLTFAVQLFAPLPVLAETLAEEPAPTVVESALPEVGAETIIETADATAALEVESAINTTVVDTTSSSTDETEAFEDEVLEEAASSSEAVVNETPEASPEAAEVEVALENSATSTTAGTSSAVTGDNSAGGNSTTTIDTGNAVAYADILNVVNTNIVDSEGLVDFINETLGYENVDLRDTFFDIFTPHIAQSTSPCGFSACADGSTNYTVSSGNSAVIVNDIEVIASSGGNSASGLAATVTTGNAYASANVVNVANTNIVDSNYLLLVFNNFSDYAGSLILPNSSFFSGLMATAPGGATVVNTSNTADVTNNVAAGAISGGNSASGDATYVATGDAIATANVTNHINQNIFNASSFSMLVRVHGDWSGDIFGLPEGMAWEMTPDGVRIYAQGGGGGPSGTEVTTQNSATIVNNVAVYALTGENQVAGNEASIVTGNAVADANIFNMANTNIIGSNWTNLIFNIYGDWSGDIAFGQPDLWLGVRAETAGGNVRANETVRYTYTVHNRGDSTAEHVRLENHFPGSTLDFKTGPSNTTPDGPLTWDLGSIPAGSTKEFTYEAQVTNLPTDTDTLPLLTRVYSSQPDADMSDNEDSVAVSIKRTLGRSGNWSQLLTGAEFDITKEATRRLAQPGDDVTYTVTFNNNGGNLFEAVLVDIMTDDSGAIVQEEFWELGEIKKGERIEVAYTVNLSSAMATGTYTNRAQIIGYHGNARDIYRTEYESPIAEHVLKVGSTPDGEVLGTCSPYLTTYLRYGELNDPDEVLKLKTFLNEHTGSNLALTSVFDRATEVAVRSFQRLYASDVLGPWGMQRDSGYVYFTTQKKINEIMCGDSADFALSAEQEAEIVAYRNLYNAMAATRPPVSLPEEAFLPLFGTDTTPPKPEVVVESKPIVQTPVEPPEPPRSFISSLTERIGGWFRSLTPEHMITMR